MSAYIITHIKIANRELHDRCEARLAAVFRKFQGRLLAADEQPKVLEGPFEPGKVVVLEFPDAAAAMAFQQSPEHVDIAADRKAGADTVAVLVRGEGDQAAEKIRAIDAWSLTQAPH